MNGISHKQAMQWIDRRLDGLLNESQLSSLDEHLQSCDSCRAYAHEMDGLSAHMQNEFHRRWDNGPSPSQTVFDRVTAKAKRIPMTNRVASGLRLFAGATTLLVLAVAINFVISRLQGTSPTTNPTETVNAGDRLLAFTSDQNGNLEIYTMHADGTSLTNLTNHPAHDTNPVWSPDGKHIAFESDRDGFTQIYIMDANGSNVIQITNDEANHKLPLNYNGTHNPWSPDSSQLVFIQEESDGEIETLYSIGINNGNKITLANGRGNERFSRDAISWAPDGKYIGYVIHISVTKDTFIPNIYIVEPDGSNVRELKNLLPAGKQLDFIYTYSWSSNGQSIVFPALTNDPLRETIYELDLQTNTFLNETETKPLVEDWRDEVSLIIDINQEGTPYVWERSDGTSNTFEASKAWGESCSLDITRSPYNNFAFGVYCPYNKFNLYWTNTDGSTIQQLLTLPIDVETGGVGDIAWSLDDRYIAFNLTSADKTDMYIVKVEESLANSSFQPLQMSVSSGEGQSIPSWRPVVNENIVEEVPTPQPKSTPNGLLAFTSDQNGNFDIYTMYPDGTGLTNITNNPAADIDPFWSPDGRRIAFTSGRNGSSHIYLMDADGSNVVQLTSGEASHQFARYIDPLNSPWSPDGSKLLFLESPPGEENWKLYVMDVNGENKRPLVEEPNTSSAISWSPDGQHIALIADDPHNLGGDRIYVVNADGSDLRELTKSLQQSEQLSSYDYQWSPDSQSIFFVAFFQKPDPVWTAYEAQLDDLSLITHATTNDIMYGWWNNVYLVNNSSASAPFEWVRPDGTTTAFNPREKCKSVDTYMSNDFAIPSPHGNWLLTGHCSNSDTWFYWANSDGTIIKPVVNSPIPLLADQMSPISWSPDDRFITFTVSSADYSDLYILNVSEARSDHFIPPVKTEKSYGVTWQPTTDEKIVQDVSTSRTNFALQGLLAFTSDQNGNYDIYTMQADGGELTNITDDPSADFSPFWSPDGQRIAFISDRSGSIQIYLMDADGSNATQLTNGEGDYWFDINGYTPWSPDSRKLIFGHKSPEEEGGRLYVIDIYETTITLLTNEPGSYLLPSWSPDGKHIGFTAYTDRGPADIFMVGSDGMGLTKLTENLPGGEFVPLDYYWSQDEEHLIFITEGGTYSTVYNASPDGSLSVIQEAGENQHILDWWNGTTLVDKPLGTMAWLRPDASQSTLELCQRKRDTESMAYKRSYNGNQFLASNCSDNQWMFYWANPDGTEIDQLLDLPLSINQDGLFNLSWSLDDRYIAFVGLDTKTLYVLDVAKAREDPSIQPLIMVNSAGPSWQPVP